MNFETWKTAILALNRYEDGDDSKKFTDLIDSLPSDEIKKEHIELLLNTFSNHDDYGIQECVFHVLERAEEPLYLQTLAAKFGDLIENASEQEWPLLILGRIINSNNPDLIRKLIDTAKGAKDNVMFNFIQSPYFMNNYPEIIKYL